MCYNVNLYYMMSCPIFIALILHNNYNAAEYIIFIMYCVYITLHPREQMKGHQVSQLVSKHISLVHGSY